MIKASVELAFCYVEVCRGRSVWGLVVEGEDAAFCEGKECIFFGNFYARHEFVGGLAEGFEAAGACVDGDALLEEFVDEFFGGAIGLNFEVR